LEREEIEGIAVGIGPGSYTGIRSALALAQGWQLAAGVKLVGIASVECLAAGAQAAGWFGAVNVVIDAQRNEFYLARYEVGASGYREVEELRLVRADEVGLRANVGEIIVGPEVTRWFGGGKILFPEARVLGELAEGRKNFVSGEKLEPIYLRETNFVKAPPLRVLPGEKG
jgi:tRNA threonylcarbamoyl adenosine modification protein YeaZ